MPQTLPETPRPSLDSPHIRDYPWGDYPHVKNHLQLAVTMLALNPLLGIVAFNHACKVERLLFQGNLHAAQEAARKANRWIWLSFIPISPILPVLILMLMINL